MPLRLLFMVLACVAALAGPQAQACKGSEDILQSPLALPDDVRLNMFNAGSVLIVSQPGCGSAYPMVFAINLTSANKGDIKAMDAVGLMYATGAGVKQDWPEARRWLEAAAGKGSGPAHYRLGIMAERGLGGAQDLAAAHRHYRAGSDAGLAWATTNLSVLYLQGIGVAADPAEAARLFELARSQGDPTAAYNLAIIHAQGMVAGKVDLPKAYSLAEEAARADNPGAMRLLGYFLANGNGTARDPESAFVWASLAGQRGDAVGLELSRRVEPKLTPEQLTSAKQRLKQCVKDGAKLCK